MAPSPRDLERHPLPSFIAVDGTRWTHTRARGWTGERTEWMMVTNHGPLGIQTNAEREREVREEAASALRQRSLAMLRHNDEALQLMNSSADTLSAYMNSLLAVTADLQRDSRRGWRMPVIDDVAAAAYGDREATEEIVQDESSSESDSDPPPIALASDSVDSDSDEDQRPLPNSPRLSPRQRQRERAMTRMRMAFAQAREIIQQSRMQRNELLSPRTFEHEMNDALEQADTFLHVNAPEPASPPPSDNVEATEIEISSLTDLIRIQEHWMNSIDSLSDPARTLELCKAHLTSQVERLEGLMARELISEYEYLTWMNQFKLAYDAATACRQSY